MFASVVVLMAVYRNVICTDLTSGAANRFINIKHSFFDVTIIKSLQLKMHSYYHHHNICMHLRENAR